MRGLQTIATQLCMQERTVLELMVAGVAFRKADEFMIISHAGDELGRVSIHYVESTIHRLRRQGIERSFYPGLDGGLTYGFESWVDHEEQGRLMDHYWKNPVRIH
jgi:hypothetical protein